MSAPRITVCIPTYNRAYFLRQALDSLCHQGLAPDEYIVAISDNASSDQTPDVVAEYRDKLRISYSRNPENIGQRANWDIVTAQCKTPYLVWLPDDDLLAPGQLRRALSVFDAHEGAVLVASLAIIQGYPGAPQSYVHGMFLRATMQTSYVQPYVWERVEWLALALVTTPLSLIGSVFKYNAFCQCEVWKPYSLWADRLLLAEMGLQGKVVSLPWIGGYYRTGDHQTGRQLSKTHSHESSMVTEHILNLCTMQSIPVIEFWIEQICVAPPHLQELYLNLLRGSLPPPLYKTIVCRSKSSLKAKSLKTLAHLESLGLRVPWRIVNLMKAIQYLVG